MFFIHVGTGQWAETFNTTQIRLSIASIEEYTKFNIATQSVFQDLLLNTHWELQWLMDPKGDKAATKWGRHSTKFAAPIISDTTLKDMAMAKQRQGIHIQIVFQAAKFAEWEERQQRKEELPIAEIIRSKEDSNHLKIEIDYPRKKIYQICYKIYEMAKQKKPHADEWKVLEDGSNEILISNLWQFKKYTIQISIKNRYTNVYGISRIKSGYEIRSHKIRFDGDLDGVQLSEQHEFEKLNHEGVYIWCKTQLKSNAFDDIRKMSCGTMTISYILTMIEGFKQLKGNAFLWKETTSQQIIGNLLKVPQGKQFKKDNMIDTNEDAFSIHLICSILSRLRVMAFKQETKLGYIPNNEYVVYFWCFFHDNPKSDIYIRCCELSLS